MRLLGRVVLAMAPKERLVAVLTADQLLTYLAWGVFILVFLVVLVQAARRPSRAHIDIALLFAAPALIIVVAVAVQAGALVPRGIAVYIASSAILALPYLLVRLVDDIVVVSLWIRRSIEALLAAALACIWFLPLDRPQWLNLVLLFYVIGVLAYVVGVSIRATLRARGVTRRRLTAMSMGSLFLTMNLAASSLGSWLPEQVSFWRSLSEVLGLLAGLSYLVGFAPPRWLRRAWQEPELRAFLSRAATLPRLPHTLAIVQALEQGAAAAVGIAHARIGLWREDTQLLVFDNGDRQATLAPDDELPTARAFRTQQPVFSPDTRYSAEILARAPHAKIASAVLAAPITAGARRLGVLVAYAPRAPIFADDDLALIQLLADQAAVILESRALIDETARIHGREEATRLKEDFLSAAAHDLKTPLTTLVARAQLMERRALRDPAAPADLASLQILIAESQRLKRLVIDLLDATRVEQGYLIGRIQAVDLVGLVQEICTRLATPQHPCTIDGDQRLVGLYDQHRIAQLIENLVENAIKYSPDGGPIRIAVQHDTSTVDIRVTDRGLGIPADDIPLLFTRFHRGANVDDRRFPGMGLGLFICKGIVEQHGGRITIQSQLGQGSTFHVHLPFISSE
jgi:signal transduction histidine kinase